MGVKHQLILGVILIWSLCLSYGTATEVNSTTVENKIEDVSHRNVKIEKLPKTETEQKDVHTINTQENSTTIRSNIISHETSTVIDTNTSAGAVTSAAKEENTIKKDSIENSREENARSIDIEKYVSPEFQNNVFTMPNFPDTEKYFAFKASTEKPSSSFSDFDLTTPKSDFFDNKFKELSEELRQKLEQDFDDNQNDNDHDHDPDDGNEHDHEDFHDNDDNESDDDDEMHVDKTLEEPKIKTNTTFNYKEMKNIIVKNNTDGKSHNDVIVEKVKKVNYVSNFNDTKIYDYDSKDDVDTASPKNETPTTRKPINLTKPPNNENNSDILNNKIETGTLKAIASSTTEFTATKRSVDAQLARESQLEKLVMAPVTTERAENVSSSSTKTPDIIATTIDTEEATTAEQETTSVSDETTIVHSTKTVTKTELFTTTVAMNDDSTTTEIADTTTTVDDNFNETTTYEITESSHIVDETIKDITTTDAMTTTIASTTTERIDTTTIPEISTTEMTTKTHEIITTEDVATTMITTKRSHGLTPHANASQDKTTAATTITTTSSKPVTTVKTDLEVPSTVSNSINAETTTVASIKINISTITTTITPTTAEIVFRNELFTDEITETPYGTETSVGTSGPIDDSGNASAVVIAISTIGAICLILLAGLLYIMRKRQKRFNYKQRCRPVSLDDYSVDNLSAYNNSVRRKGALMRQSKRSYGNPAFDDPSAPSHPLNFPALSKFATNMEDIKLEFEDIPQITAKTSELPEGCEPKNRYANVIPLPETRVSLKSIDGYPNSDYINANFVTGPDRTKGFYIACQAPMQNTVDDFWRMIWEQQSKVILMVTHFFENGVEKCVDYLPPSEVLDCHRLFGDFQVTLKKRDVKEKYIISSLQLKNMVSNSWREVTHFWYLGWPEKGIPSEANSLIAFLIEARSFMKTSTLDRNAVANGTSSLPRTEVNPVVVHCSPGTGRTGVVIACDIAIREFEQTRLVDIPKIVYMIRRDRANAVQTKEQYIFIYKVVNLYATKLAGGALESL